MRLKPKQGRRSDLRFELSIISYDSGKSLEKVAKDFWRLMQRNEENIENSEDREIAVINYLSTNLYD